MAGLRASFEKVPAEQRLTLTWDQGSEMASHDLVAELFRDGVFFAHAGKPWQRPTATPPNLLVDLASSSTCSPTGSRPTG